MSRHPKCLFLLLFTARLTMKSKIKKILTIALLTVFILTSCSTVYIGFPSEEQLEHFGFGKDYFYVSK